jgi:hypothetical protein
VKKRAEPEGSFTSQQDLSLVFRKHGRALSIFTCQGQESSERGRMKKFRMTVEKYQEVCWPLEARPLKNSFSFFEMRVAEVNSVVTLSFLGDLGEKRVTFFITGSGEEKNRHYPEFSSQVLLCREPVSEELSL